MNIVNKINHFLIKSSNVAAKAPVIQKQNTTANNNPFAGPLISSQNSLKFYGQNKPIIGGFFAGYHNGKANYVGKKLFLEV